MYFWNIEMLFTNYSFKNIICYYWN